MVWPTMVTMVRSVNCAPVALAMPKSMILGTALPSDSVTITLEGLRSRWITPFWWACCTASHTGRKSSTRSRVESFRLSQYSVMGTPFTSSITK